MIGLIAKREFVSRARTRAYRIVTALLVIAAIAIPVAVSYFSEDDDDSLRSVTVGVVDGDEALLAALSDSTRTGLDITLEPVIETDIDAALDPDAEEPADVVINGVELVWHSEVDNELSFAIVGALQVQSVVDKGSQAGLTAAQTSELLIPPLIETRFVEEPDEDDDTESTRIGIAIVGAILIFIVIQTYGSLITMGVIEEKSSRVVEVLLSHIQPRQLMAGKVLGLGALAIVQFGVVLIGLLATLAVTDDFSAAPRAFLAVPLVAICGIGGFILYALMFAAAGSLVSRQEDAQQVMLPLFIPLFIGYFISAGAAGQPDSLLVRVAAIVPFTSPLVLPLRATVGEVAVWEVPVSLLLLAATIVAVLGLASRIYEFTLLRTGTRVGFADALRLSRER